MEEVNPVYLGTFIVYLLLILGVGVWGYRKTENVEDFWVYGKKLGVGLATWSYVANFVSAVSVIGFIGKVYGGGYSVLTGIILGLMLGVSGLYFVVHKIRELDFITFPDIIAEVTGSQWARPISAVVLLGNAWLYLIMQLTGAAILVTTITGVPYKYMIWVIGVVFIAYTVMGGLISVAWTDLVQGSLMVATIFFALIYMVFDLGGITAINTQLTNIDPAYTVPLGDGQWTIIGVLGSLVAFFGTIFTAQGTIVRVNATKDIKTAKLHVAWTGIILSVFYVVLIHLGGATSVKLHHAGATLETVDQAFPVLITNYLPTSIGVIIIIAAMSAILSTTDSRLHACGITTSRDIYDFFADNPSDDTLLKVSRISTVFWGLSATAIAVNPPGTIITIYEWRAILVTSALLVPIYVALYYRGLAKRAIFASIIGGTLVGFPMEILNSEGRFGIPATFLGVGTAIITLIVGHLIWSDRSESNIST